MPYPTVAVVLPALDEEASLPLVLGDLATQQVGTVIVVDNGSTDRTADVARDCGAVLVPEPRRGYGTACLAGIARARQSGADVLVIMDADHSDFAGDLPRLVDPVLSGDADLVIGDRTASADRGSLTRQQRYGNLLACWLIARATGHRYRDMGPFRAIRTSSLAALEMEDPNYGWNVEMQMKAARRGLRIREVPVRYRARIGVSKISGTVRGTVLAGTKIVWSCWRYAR